MTANALQSSPTFYIEWKALVARPEYNERPQHYRRPSVSDPPDIRDAFRRFNNPVTYRWTPGSLVTITGQERSCLQDYKVCSVFWRPDHQTYLTVPYDCTRYNVRDKAAMSILDTWEPLRFGHEAINGRCVSVVGHCRPNELLAAEGPKNWLGELIPPIHQRHDEPAFPNTAGTSYLAGDISIIMALAALSNSPEKIKETIETSFRPLNKQTWVPHGHWDRASKLYLRTRAYQCPDLWL